MTSAGALSRDGATIQLWWFASRARREKFYSQKRQWMPGAVARTKISVAVFQFNDLSCGAAAHNGIRNASLSI
jgi:hypothetical protein